LRRFPVGDARGVAGVLSVVALALLVTGCGSLSGAVRTESSLLAAQAVQEPAPAVLPGTPVPDAPVMPSGTCELAGEEPASPVTARANVAGGPAAVGVAEGDEGADPALAQTQRAPQERISTKDEEEVEEYDPWEGFNETMFEFNRKLDRYVLKPVAKAYNVVMPEPFQILIANGFDNIRFVPRAVNSLLQGKWGGAGREVARFLINSTAGIGGLFDAAKYWSIEKSREDFGQTLATWGSGPGPYLILPFLTPMTVRDGIGMAVDGAMDPLSYVLPFIWTRFAMQTGDVVNDRALNLDLFQGFEESVIDMYSAVRNAYLRRREQLIKE
jgi:phospholipid-binding lipoprotein MlaA